jgi:hypothetical protein
MPKGGLRYDPYSEPPRGQYVEAIPVAEAEIDEFDSFADDTFDMVNVGDWVDQQDGGVEEREPVVLDSRTATPPDSPLFEVEPPDVAVDDEVAADDDVAADDQVEGQDELEEQESDVEEVSAQDAVWEASRSSKWREPSHSSSWREPSHSSSWRDSSWRDDRRDNWRHSKSAAIGAKKSAAIGAKYDKKTDRGDWRQVRGLAIGAAPPPAAREPHPSGQDSKDKKKTERGTKSRAGRKVQEHRALLASSPAVALAVARMMRQGYVQASDNKMLMTAFGLPAINAMLAAASTTSTP